MVHSLSIVNVDLIDVRRLIDVESLGATSVRFNENTLTIG
jgi:hypothetical protein